MTKLTQMIEYVALIRDDAGRTTAREYFGAADHLSAKARYAGTRNVYIVGLLPLSTIRTGEVVTLLNPDNTIGTVGHVVTDRDNDPRIRCFFE